MCRQNPVLNSGYPVHFSEILLSQERRVYFGPCLKRQEADKLQEKNRAFFFFSLLFVIKNKEGN